MKTKNKNQGVTLKKVIFMLLIICSMTLLTIYAINLMLNFGVFLK
jgi:hypothetical protein